jgi:hypothetical protein
MDISTTDKLAERLPFPETAARILCLTFASGGQRNMDDLLAAGSASTTCIRPLELEGAAHPFYVYGPTVKSNCIRLDIYFADLLEDGNDTLPGVVSITH